MSERKIDYNPIICAIDENDLDKAISLIKEIKDHVPIFKLGLEFFVRNGFTGVKEISDMGVPIFLDLKLHDIPNTVGQALSMLKDLNLSMTTIHMAGGIAMIEKSLDILSSVRTRLLCVTSLTSLTTKDVIDNIPYGNWRKENESDEYMFDNLNSVNTMLFHSLFYNELFTFGSNTNGFVCPAHAAELVNHIASNAYEARAEIKEKYRKPIIVSPGIRPAGSSLDDQKAIATPKQAMNNGVDYIVIGRPITQSGNKIKAIKDILDEVGIN